MGLEGLWRDFDEVGGLWRAYGEVRGLWRAYVVGRLVEGL